MSSGDHSPVAIELFGYPDQQTLQLVDTIMGGKADLRLVNADVIGPRILGNEIEAHIGGIRLDIDRQEFGLVTQDLDNIPVQKPVTIVAYHYHIIITDMRLQIAADFLADRLRQGAVTKEADLEHLSQEVSVDEAALDGGGSLGTVEEFYSYIRLHVLQNKALIATLHAQTGNEIDLITKPGDMIGYSHDAAGKGFFVYILCGDKDLFGGLVQRATIVVFVNNCVPNDKYFYSSEVLK